MKSLLIPLLSLALGVGIAAAETLVSPKPFLQVQDGETVVFLGDSITHQSLYTQYLEDFYYTRFPERRIQFHNAGVGGDKAADALARFDDDVAAFNPDHVTILLGMNDGQYEPFSKDTLETYQRGMEEILTRIDAIGAEAIAFSPTMYDHHQFALRKNDETFRFRDRPSDPGYNSLLAYYASWLRQTAYGHDVAFVNLWGPLNDITFAMRSSQPNFSVIEDAIHPGAAGHFIMASSIIAQSNPERRTVSNIIIVRDGDQWVAGRKQGVTELRANEDESEMSFTFLASALPWVVPESTSKYDLKWGPSAPASLGYALTKAGHKLSRELLRVDGLPAGNYELCIDEIVVGTFSERQLGAKVELQNFPQTPQSQQALEVALLNQQKNDEFIRPLRDAWSKVKSLRRKNDSELFEKNYPILMAKIDTLNEQAKALENEIYRINQPVPRQYLLKRVSD
ncbi:MAG: SGNH/GDSL hydrolase family protein [Verrucomicrobiales bacterium]|nr:SGNH/GDSL hydrolase family protein [Verrucomicrobiales bacterium]